MNKTTASYYFRRLRLLIHESFQHLEMFDGEVDIDESYFAGVPKGNRGRVAAGKTPMFGLLKRNSRGSTVIIPNAESPTLISMTREKVKPDSMIYTDTFKSYNALDVKELKHFRINHSDPKEQ